MLGSPLGWGRGASRKGTHRSMVTETGSQGAGLEGAIFPGLAQPAALPCPHPCYCALFLPRPASSVPVSSGWRHHGGHRGFPHTPTPSRWCPAPNTPGALRDPGLIWTCTDHLPHLTISFMQQTHCACPMLSHLLRVSGARSTARIQVQSQVHHVIRAGPGARLRGVSRAGLRA